jgi:hypothetical protein
VSRSTFIAMKVDVNEQIHGHIERNNALKQSLLEKGMRLEDKRSMELHFWAFNKKTAVMLAKSLYDQGLLVLALSPVESEDSRWTVEAGIKDTVEHLTHISQINFTSWS